MTREQQIDAALKLLAPPADKIEQCHTHILKWLDRITAMTKPKPEFDFDIVFWLGRPPRPQLPSYVAALGAYELLKFWGHNPTTTDDGEWDQLAVILFGKRGADLHRQILKVRSEVTRSSSADDEKLDERRREILEEIRRNMTPGQRQ